MFCPRTSLSPILVAQPRCSVMERGVPRSLTLETNVAYFWEKQRDREIETPLLKGVLNLTPSGTQGKSKNLKRVWVITPADFSESPGKVRGNKLTMGKQTMVVAILRRLFYHWILVLARIILETFIKLISAGTWFKH